MALQTLRLRGFLRSPVVNNLARRLPVGQALEDFGPILSWFNEGAGDGKDRCIAPEHRRVRRSIGGCSGSDFFPAFGTHRFFQALVKPTARCAIGKRWSDRVCRNKALPSAGAALSGQISRLRRVTAALPNAINVLDPVLCEGWQPSIHRSRDSRKFSTFPT